MGVADLISRSWRREHRGSCRTLELGLKSEVDRVQSVGPCEGCSYVKLKEEQGSRAMKKSGYLQEFRFLTWEKRVIKKRLEGYDSP